MSDEDELSEVARLLEALDMTDGAHGGALRLTLRVWHKHDAERQVSVDHVWHLQVLADQLRQCIAESNNWRGLVNTGRAILAKD